MDAAFSFLGLATLVGASLVMLSILLGLITSRAGMPLLLIFLGVGMLAGEDGPGGIIFNNYEFSFWIANIALAMILLDGGIRTEFSIFRVALKPAIVLSTAGVLLTCILLATLAVLLFDFPLPIALLFGAIVSSTDAAAVFGLLKNSGVRLNERVEATLEVESGINDPMAIFLTILAISMVSMGLDGEKLDLAGVGWMLIKQAGVGFLLAYAWGHLFVRILRRLKIETSSNHGLNALLVFASGLAVFGLSTLAGGSGFLSVYIFGLILGNQKTRFVKTITPAMDGLAWLFQAAMFLLLGLLVTPSAMMDSLAPGLGLALLLMFVVRPLAIIPCLIPFRYTLKEMLFISWVGLRGAVPIVLAIFPIIAGVDDRHKMLDLSLLVVMTSLLMQGSTITFMAKKLGLILPDKTDQPAQRKAFGNFGLDGAAPMSDIATFYSLELEDATGISLQEWIKKRLAKPPVVGDIVTVQDISFVVKEMSGPNIVKVGLL